MNERTYLWGGLSIGLFILCFATPLPSTLMAFFLMGVVPGTTITIPAWAMLITYPLGFLALCYWISHQSMLIGEKKRPTKPVRSVTKKSQKRSKAKTPARTRRRYSATSEA